MNCQDFESNIIGLARDQFTDADLSGQSLAHARVCELCGERLAEEQALIAGIRAVCSEISAAAAPAHVESALLVNFRAQVRQRNAPVARSLPLRKRIRQWKSGVAYVAAVVVIILIGMMWFKSNPALPKEPVISKQSVETPALDGEQPVADRKTASVITDTPPPKKRRHVRQAMAQQEGDVAGRFYSLAGEGELVSLESGRVVRVEMSASSLIPFGLPLTAETHAQTVQADLLIGQDGLARAIRFLPADQITKTQ